MGEDTVVRFQKPESAHDAMMDLLRQGRNVPARPRQDGAVIVAIESSEALHFASFRTRMTRAMIGPTPGRDLSCW
jgi:hypothetical protein